MKINEIYFEEIDSTSTYIKNHFHELDNFTFVSTSFQSKGRGRTNRVWYSNKKENIMFSFLITNKLLIKKYKDLSLASAYVLANVIKKNFPILSIKIKWPNDVYVNNKKISGILLESHIDNQEIDGIIIGIGLNCNQIVFPEDLIYPVTSLKKELNLDIDISLLRKTIEEELYLYLNSLKKGNIEHITFSKNNNYLKDKVVYANINNEKKLIEVIDINDDCSLKIKIDDKIIDIISGEITFH